MRECSCHEVRSEDLRTEVVAHDGLQRLVHNECNRIFDPAVKARSERHAPYLPGVEYR